MTSSLLVHIDGHDSATQRQSSLRRSTRRKSAGSGNDGGGGSGAAQATTRKRTRRKTPAAAAAAVLQETAQQKPLAPLEAVGGGATLLATQSPERQQQQQSVSLPIPGCLQHLHVSGDTACGTESAAGVGNTIPMLPVAVVVNVSNSNELRRVTMTSEVFANLLGSIVAAATPTAHAGVGMGSWLPVLLATGVLQTPRPPTAIESAFAAHRKKILVAFGAGAGAGGDAVTQLITVRLVELLRRAIVLDEGPAESVSVSDAGEAASLPRSAAAVTAYMARFDTSRSERCAMCRSINGLDLDATTTATTTATHTAHSNAMPFTHAEWHHLMTLFGSVLAFTPLSLTFHPGSCTMVQSATAATAKSRLSQFKTELSRCK